MALASTVYVEVDNNAAGIVGAATSTSRSYTAGDMVTAVYMNAGAPGTVFSISNSGTAQTWNIIKQLAASNNCDVSVWYCVMSTTQAMTITAQTDNDDVNAHMIVIVESGQHATTPVPAGNVFGSSSATDVSQAITPTSAGSDLWLCAADWAQTNTFAAIANCTKTDGVNVSGQYTTCLIYPTTKPRPDTSAFTLGETDTSGTIAWAAWEVQAAAASASAAVTGTATASITEADAVAGGKTIIITLTGDTWVASGGTFDGQRSAIIQGLDSAQSEAGGWNAKVRDVIAVTSVVRTSATVVTITLPAVADYNITATETITVTPPGSALTGGNPLTATPTFTVAPVTAGTNLIRGVKTLGGGMQNLTGGTA